MKDRNRLLREKRYTDHQLEQVKKILIDHEKKKGISKIINIFWETKTILLIITALAYFLGIIFFSCLKLFFKTIST